MNTLKTIIAAIIGIVLATSAAAVDLIVADSAGISTQFFRQVRTTYQECWAENVSVKLPSLESLSMGEFIDSSADGVADNQVRLCKRVPASVYGTIIVEPVVGEHTDNLLLPLQYVNHSSWSNRTVNDYKQPLSGYAIIYHYGIRDITVVFSYNTRHIVMISMEVM
jgi:hypothetical protein